MVTLTIRLESLERPLQTCPLIYTFLNLHKSLVRPQLEYGNAIWALFSVWIKRKWKMLKEQPQD